MFFKLPLCLCLSYFFKILLEAKVILFRSEIIFAFLVHLWLNLQTEHHYANLHLQWHCQKPFFCYLSHYHQTKCLQYICMSSVIILPLKGLFSSKTSSTKSIKVILFFLFSCSTVYRIRFLFKIKELIILFLCFYFDCFSILNLRINVGMFNFFIFGRLK